MAEKRSIKVSLGTTVCIFIIILLVIALGGMYYYYNYIANNNETKNDINTSDTIENTVNIIEQTTKNNDNNSELKTDIVNKVVIENLLKNKGNYEYLKIKSIKEEKGKYLVEADFYVPTPITDTEYSEMVNNKKIVLDNKEYIFENSDQAYNPGYGYIYLPGELAENGYWIEKTKDGYIFIHEIGGVYNIINEIKEQYKFYLDGNTEVNEIAGAEDSMKLNSYLTNNEDIDMNNIFVQVLYSEDNKTYNNNLTVLVDKR